MISKSTFDRPRCWPGDLLRRVGASETAALAALWHDLGKYAAEFQEMITASDPEAHLEGVRAGSRQRVNHSSAGTLWALSPSLDQMVG